MFKVGKSFASLIILIETLFGNKLLKGASLLVIVISLVFNNAIAQQSIPSKHQKVKSAKALKKALKEKDREEEEHDNPNAAAQFEFNQMMDPATGTVPTERLINAYNQTMQSKQNVQLKKGNPGLFTNSLLPLSWEERGPNGDALGAGRIRAIMVDSSDVTHKTVWVGGVDGGLWKTTDITTSPANWILVNDFLPNLAVSAICQDPTNYNTMYFCTGEAYINAGGNFNYERIGGVGVFKSTDHGVTWNLLPNTSSYVYCTRILCDYQGNIYLATKGTGLARSNDGGNTWTNITPATAPNQDICDLEISSTGAPARLHIVTGIGTTQVYRYTDVPSTVTSAAGWNAPATPFPSYDRRAEIAVSGNVLYATPCDNSNTAFTMYKSTDGGVNWAATAAQPSTGSGQGWYDLIVAINPADANQCITGQQSLRKTSNGGASWSVIGSAVHSDQQGIAWYDGGTKLIVACDGGIYYSSDGGATFQDRNIGLRVKQFYSVAMHPTNKNVFFGGTQDNGTYRFTQSGLTNAVHVFGGDGAIDAIDQDEPQYWFLGTPVASTGFALFRSTDGGVSFNQVALSGINSNSTRFINPFDYNSSDNKLYAAYSAGQFFRWNDPQTGSSGNGFSLPALNSQYVTAVTASPNTVSRVYLGTGLISGVAGGTIVKVDGANTGTPVGTTISQAGMPTGNVTVGCIAAGTDDQNLMACYINYGINNIWVSTNGGGSWTAIDGNLPDMPVHWCMFYPGDNTRAYIATETGVWETDLIDGANTVWVANPTFPNVSTWMIKYRPNDRTIAAATHGRGIWTAKIFPVGCSLPTVTAPTVTQPTACPAAQTGTIAVNATGSGVIEYSLNAGAWQTSNTYSGLVPGVYRICARIQGTDSACFIDYSGNPIIINANQTTVSTVSYTGPPVAIPDAPAAGMNIPLTVSGLSGNLTDLNFRLDAAPTGTCDATSGNTNASMDHTYVGDLVFTLISPSGTRVTLLSNIASTGYNFCNVTLDDEGGYSSIQDFAGQPVTGNFSPNEPLSAFDGENPNGTWTLNVTDVGPGDVGSLRRFSLVITTPKPCPSITTTGTLTAFTTCAGIESAEQTFTVAGANLNSNIVVNAPTGFEVSLTTSNGFGNSVSLTQVDGVVNATTVYARLAASATGNPSGSFACSSSGANIQNAVANGTVNPLPTPSISGALNFCSASSTTLDAGSYSSYLWSTSETTSSINVNSYGSFTVTVTDGNGCIGQTSVSTSITPAPGGLSTNNIASTSAVAHWASAGVGVTYFIEKRPVGATAYDLGWTTTSHSWQMKNMNTGTQYEWHVRIVCAPGQFSDWSPLQQFTTVVPICTNKPTGLSATNLTTTSAKLHWTLMSPVPDNYQLRYHIIGSSTWIKKTGAGTAILKQITALIAGSNYEWQIRGRCGTVAPYDFSNWSALSTFSLPTVRLGGDELSKGVSVYPNPTTGMVTLQIPDCNNCIYKLTMYDVPGNVVYTNPKPVTNNSQLSLDFSNLAKGIYSLSVDDGDNKKTVKVVIE